MKTVFDLLACLGCLVIATIVVGWIPTSPALRWIDIALTFIAGLAMLRNTLQALVGLVRR